MRATLSAVIVFTLAFTGLFYGGVAIAEQGNAAHTHIGHVADGWRDTPDNQGLLPTAIAEAKIAAQHAALAAKDPSNLDAMKRHTGHVLNAVDPEAMANGPGLGYGVKRAAAGAATHIELAAKSDGASGASRRTRITSRPRPGTPSRAPTRSSRSPGRSRWPARPPRRRRSSPSSTRSPSS